MLAAATPTSVGPTDVAVGPAGNIYFTDFRSYSVKGTNNHISEDVIDEIAPGTTNSSGVAPALARYGLTLSGAPLDAIGVDPAGDVYVTDAGGNSVTEYSGGSAAATISGASTGLAGPNGLFIAPATATVTVPLEAAGGVLLTGLVGARFVMYQWRRRPARAR